jgi:hypothetical protein
MNSRWTDHANATDLLVHTVDESGFDMADLISSVLALYFQKNMASSNSESPVEGANVEEGCALALSSQNVALAAKPCR